MKLFGKTNIDATEGPMLSKIILYVIPLMLSFIIQNLFNVADIAVLGNMADSAAVASVNATGAIVALVVNAFIGIAVGTRIVLARSIGKKDEEQIRFVTDTSLIFAFVMGLAVAVVGFTLAPWFLDLTGCPKECYDGALLYIRIYVCAAPVILIYNFGSAILTADGDTQRPLYYIMIGGATNVVLNIILCLILPQKVAAVAIATVAAQVVGGGLVLRRLFTMDGHCKVIISQMRFNIRSLGKVLATGVPTALVNAIFPLSNLQIQSAINSFGVSAMAGSGASATIEMMAYAGGQFGITSAVFIGQNIGAGKPDRVRRSFNICALLSVGVGIIVGVSLFLSGRFWLALIIGSDKEAIEYGIIKMACICLPVFINSLTNVYESSLQTRGYAFLASVNAIVFVLVFRIIWMQFVFTQYPTWLCLMLCFTVSWILRLLFDMAIHPFIRKKSDLKLFRQ